MSAPTDISSSSPASSLPLTVGKYAFLLADADLADCNLRLVPGSGSQMRNASSASTVLSTVPAFGGEEDATFSEEFKHVTIDEKSDGSVTLPCHAIVLCANSAYFRSKLLGGHHAKPSVGGKREIEEAVDPKDVPSVKALIRFMYTEVRKVEVLKGEQFRIMHVLYFVRLNVYFMIVCFWQVLEFNQGADSPAELISILRVAGRFKVSANVAADHL